MQLVFKRNKDKKKDSEFQNSRAILGGKFKFEENEEPRIVIDPAKAFCQRMKFVMRMKRRMKEFKARKLSKI